MFDAGKAFAVATIIAFVVFIIWAKTTAGRSVLSRVLGEPTRQTPAKKRSAKSGKASTSAQKQKQKRQ